MRIKTPILLLGLALFPLTMVGCGGSEATLSGQVSLDGELVLAVEDIRGTVLLQPKEKGGAPATSKLEANGSYSVATGSSKGIAQGEYLISLNIVRLISPAEEGGRPMPQRISPPRYASVKTSGLSVTVGPGRNVYDIELESEGNADD